VLIYAGIDEAGYGPLLGPLCVGLTAFVLPEHDADEGAPNLWRLLNSAVCRRRTDRRNRIAVDDSKKLKGAANSKSHPLTHLERGALSFCTATGAMPANDDDLLDRLLGEKPAAGWYRNTTPLPVAGDTGQIQIAASRLRRTLDRAGIACPILRCEVIDAAAFNEQIDLMGNKAAVNLAAALRLVDAVRRQWPDAHPRVICDRHGGRTHYREELQTAWPDASIRVLAESEALSRYRLDLPAGPLTISFIKDAERHHFPVALASMLAKYTRDLLMLRLNRFFQAELPDLRPTAGYYTDARRYLDDIEVVVRRLKLPRRELVRQA
jgi:ribonuclease HII